MNKIKILNKISIIIIVIIIIVIMLLYKLNQIVSPILMVHAKETAYNLITRTINTSVSTSIENLKVEDLFITSYDSNGEIISIDFDSMIVNRLLSSISLNIENKMSNLDNVSYNIPFGIIFKNAFLNNLGPHIPVKLKLVGSIVNDIDTKITNYGINNALIEVYVHITVNIKVVLPLISDNISVELSVPIALKLIRGNVPQYYSGTGSNPLLSIPIE